MRSLQEWADFTGWYPVLQKPKRSMYGQNIYVLFEQKPVCVNLGDRGLWAAISGGFVIDIPEQLVIPFEGGWKDSLHYPQCEGTSKIKKD